MNPAASRANRVADFRRQAAGSPFETSLLPAGKHQPRDGRAIANWLLREPIARPSCFCCRVTFSPTRRPGAFLTAIASRTPAGGTAVGAVCAECWGSKSAVKIEAAALAVLRRNLATRGDFF
jgi:hypothetical protein